MDFDEEPVCHATSHRRRRRAHARHSLWQRTTSVDGATGLGDEGIESLAGSPLLPQCPREDDSIMRIRFHSGLLGGAGSAAPQGVHECGRPFGARRTPRAHLSSRAWPLGVAGHVGSPRRPGQARGRRQLFRRDQEQSLTPASSSSCRVRHRSHAEEHHRPGLATGAVFQVELDGLEPTTSSMPSRRSPS